jgi:hypothetical protein
MKIQFIARTMGTVNGTKGAESIVVASNQIEADIKWTPLHVGNAASRPNGLPLAIIEINMIDDAGNISRQWLNGWLGRG